MIREKNKGDISEEEWGNRAKGERRTDVDLRTRDVELATFERCGFCKARDCVFGNGVWRREGARDVCGERAVVDYSACVTVEIVSESCRIRKMSD